jgi:thiol:disulfide interchange protein DsbG
LVSKAQRQQRAIKLVSGMGRAGKVKDIFSAPDGSTGVVIEAPEGTFVGWMIDGIDAVWVGAKFDPQGINQTQQEMIARGYAQPTNTPANAQAAPATGQGTASANSPMTSQGLLKAAMQSPGFTEGTAGPVWTVYIDGNCGFCTQLWRNLRNPIAAGQIRVRWAPVAVIAPTSAGQAAALLQSDQPVVLLTQHGTTGAHIPSATVMPATQQQIDANNAMLRALNAGKPAATPTIVLPAADGARVITGLPPDLNALIQQGGRS